MAHRTPKINDTVKFTDQQQAILNDAVEQLMEAGGLTALTQAHFNEAMKIVAQRFINAALQGELKHHLTQEDENLIKAVWEAVAPMIRAQVEQIDSRAKARLQIEHDEASRVREAADEALASVEKKERRLEELDEQVRGLQEDLAKLKGALEQANTENLRLAAENTQLHEALDKSLQEEAKAQASLQSMKRLLPFFCPFWRWVNFYVVLRVNSYVA